MDSEMFLRHRGDGRRSWWVLLSPRREVGAGDSRWKLLVLTAQYRGFESKASLMSSGLGEQEVE